MSTQRDTDARALVAHKEAYYAAVEASGAAARCNQLDRGHVDAVLTAGRKVDDASETFRRRWHPRAHRVVVAQGEVFTVSATGRSTRVVWPRDSEGVATGEDRRDDGT